MDSKLHILATHICEKTDDMYLFIDFLNRNLKDKDVVVGMSKCHDNPDKFEITLYRTDLA